MGADERVTRTNIGQRHLSLRRILFGFCILALVVTFLLPVLTEPYIHSRGQPPCHFNLKQIMIGIYYYHEEFGVLPPPYTSNPRGKRLHSWRTLILPYLKQKRLYDRLRLNEPWNSPHNLDVETQFGNEARTLFKCPNHPNKGEAGWSDTCYLAIVGQRTVWQADNSLSFRDVTDGTTNTLAVVEISNSETHWMEPYDVDFRQMFPKADFVRGSRVSSYHSGDGWGAPTGRAYVGVCDGSVRFLSETVPTDLLEQLVIIDDGLPLDGWRGRLDRSR